GFLEEVVALCLVFLLRGGFQFGHRLIHILCLFIEAVQIQANFRLSCIFSRSLYCHFPPGAPTQSAIPSFANICPNAYPCLANHLMSFSTSSSCIYSSSDTFHLQNYSFFQLPLCSSIKHLSLPRLPSSLIIKKRREFFKSIHHLFHGIASVLS